MFPIVSFPAGFGRSQYSIAVMSDQVAGWITGSLKK